jgi:hypothetical protein
MRCALPFAVPVYRSLTPGQMAMPRHPDPLVAADRRGVPSHRLPGDRVTALPRKPFGTATQGLTTCVFRLLTTEPTVPFRSLPPWSTARCSSTTLEAMARAWRPARLRRQRAPVGSRTIDVAARTTIMRPAVEWMHC